MKRILSLILAAVMLAACLASCAVPTARNSFAAHIRLTSSDAEDAAAWLSARLGDRLTRSVMLGTSADGYAVDVSALEDDGYFIRSFGREDVLFAKTPTGLDRAVRRYAKTIESGAAVTDVTYHEGYRVKKLTIAGNDVSEYCVVYPDDASPSVKTAASELIKYIAASCGAALSKYTESEYAADSERPERRIILTEGDETLGDEGFRIIVTEDGTLTINGGKWRGTIYGVWDLVEDDLGWRFPGSGSNWIGKPYFIPVEKREFLYEADHIDLTSAIDRTETPSIPLVRGGNTGDKRLKDTYRLSGELGYYGWSPATCHGLQSYHKVIFSGEYEGLYLGADVTGKQPCFTNDEIIEAIEHYVLTSIQTHLDAGQQIGKEITCYDLGHWDYGGESFCQCKNCRAVEKVEGSHSGPVIQMGNRICATLDEQYYGVGVSVFGYGGTDLPPLKTRPAHNLYVAFCYHVSNVGSVSCQNHCLSGKDCEQEIKYKGYFYTGEKYSNYYPATELEGWAKIMDPARIQVWFYPSNSRNYCYNAPVYRTILQNIKYLDSVGVNHVFVDTQWINDGLINEELTVYLLLHFAWNCDVTEEEELALIREWFEIVYGRDAGDILYELAMLAERAGDLAGCWSSLSNQVDYVDYGFVSKNAEMIWDGCERAISLAEDKAGEDLIRKYAAGLCYMALVSRYEQMYVNGTEEEKTFITEKYREVWETFRYYDLCTWGDIGKNQQNYAPETFDPDVDPHLWIDVDFYEEKYLH